MKNNCLFRFVCFVFSLVGFCFGHLNLYLNLHEVRRLLGLEAELYYVREGVINEYAFNFVILVPFKLNSLYFTWESLAERPLPYSIAVDTSDYEVLHSTKLNISSSGLIPVASQLFSISFQCSGASNAEVDINIHINITLTPNNITQLVLHRKKICLKSEGLSTQVTIDKEPIPSNSIKIFYVALSSAFALIIIVIVFITVNHIGHKKFLRTTQDNNGVIHPTFVSTTLRNSRSPSNFLRIPSYSLVEEPLKDLQECITELSIQRCRIRLSKILLEGTFGRVYRGSYASEDGVEEEVLVKTVTDHASQIQTGLLLQEGMSMYGLNHKNILSVQGVSVEDHAAPFLLYPFKNFTNMKIFLQKCKLCTEGIAHTLTTQEVVDMALQIIHALQYLHKKHLLHKDLAARNCVVNDKLRVQITDNALSRDLFPSDYHCLGDNENRPIKWLALEGLLTKTFSSSSDVWSFGVLLWELTTLAQQPYTEIDPFEMAAYLKDGYRLAQPINCPDELFAVMAYCWAMSPEERPTILQLQVCLQEFYTQLTRYV